MQMASAQLPLAAFNLCFHQHKFSFEIFIKETSTCEYSTFSLDMNIPAWIEKLDFCWFAEDERGCVATFHCSHIDGEPLHFIPDLVIEQYTKAHYDALLEVVLDILPVTNQPRTVQKGFSAWDSARGLYEYVYIAEAEQFNLASVPNLDIEAQELRLHSPVAFDSLVLRLSTVEYALKTHISIKEIDHFLVCR